MHIVFAGVILILVLAILLKKYWSAKTIERANTDMQQHYDELAKGKVDLETLEVEDDVVDTAIEIQKRRKEIDKKRSKLK